MYAMDTEPTNSSTSAVTNSSSVSVNSTQQHTQSAVSSWVSDNTILDGETLIPNASATATSVNNNTHNNNNPTHASDTNNPSSSLYQASPASSSEDISLSNLTHEQLKQLHLTFLQPNPTKVVRMQMPRRQQQQQGNNNPASPSQSQQQVPTSPSSSISQPAPTRVINTSAGTFVDNGDFPLDFSPIPVQTYTAINPNQAFISGSLGPQKVQAQAISQQQVLNRGVMNQAYPLQYRFSASPDQKLPQQYLVHPAAEAVVASRRAQQQQQQQQQAQQAQQQRQPAQTTTRKRKSQPSAAEARAAAASPTDDEDQDPHQDAKRQKRHSNNDDNRLVKNRQAAQLFRQRQKQHIKDLEDKVAAVNDVNVSLNAKVDVLKAENKLVKEQLQYLRGFVATALQCAFPQNKEELQKSWDVFKQSEEERKEREPKEKSTSAAELLAASEDKEKRKHDLASSLAAGGGGDYDDDEDL